MRTPLIIAAAALGALSAHAAAGPGAKGTPPVAGAQVSRFVPTVGPVITEGPGLTDNFDSYATGSTIAGQGGWTLWYSGGGDATLTNAQAASAPNSLLLAPTSDVVHTLNITGGKWTFRLKTFLPSSLPPGSGGFIILLSAYGSAATDRWAIQIALNDFGAGGQTLPYMIESQFDGGVLPLVMDQWVEFRSEIDLTTDQVTNFYNNQQLGAVHPWTNNGFASGAGPLAIAAIDLYSATGTPVYYDDLSLTASGCYPDCNQSGTLTIADFGCFQAAFSNNLPYADCNQSGGLTIADFGCFQAAFVAGCP